MHLPIYSPHDFMHLLKITPQSFVLQGIKSWPAQPFPIAQALKSWKHSRMFSVHSFDLNNFQLLLTNPWLMKANVLVLRPPLHFNWNFKLILQLFCHRTKSHEFSFILDCSLHYRNWITPFWKFAFLFSYYSTGVLSSFYSVTLWPLCIILILASCTSFL